MAKVGTLSLGDKVKFNQLYEETAPGATGVVIDFYHSGEANELVTVKLDGSDRRTTCYAKRLDLLPATKVKSYAATGKGAKTRAYRRISAISKLADKGYSVRRIANRLGLSKSSVHRAMQAELRGA